MALKGTIPRDFGNLTFLALNDLGSNNFHGNLPQEMTRLHRLKFLDLSFNNFRGEVPSSMPPVTVGNLSTSLTKIYAPSCKIKGRIPNEVGKLSHLIDFDHSENNMVGWIRTSIGNLRNLQGCFLSNNKLIGSIGDDICKLQCLDVIDLNQNIFRFSS
ncbi:receptor-like protein 35 [Capsicum annuum]|uniref:receptor-like protein 35 n=1 Tax=Capsicum annuum TaxID=4072 RepID=UPI001FB06D8B|nr:receptor-like protein 35 [Capsicum annuum]